MPGEEVLIYIEVEGAEFAPAPEGGVGCRLMFGLTLKNDHQGTAWHEAKYGEYAPVFEGGIRDLHAALTWRVPNDLQPGRYHLTVQAVEDATKRLGENLISFNVGRRATNPEQRPTAGYGGPDIGRAVNEANRAFQGGGAAAQGGPGNLWNSDFGKQQQFELQRQYERSRKVE